MKNKNCGKRTNFEISTQIDRLSKEKIEVVLTKRWEDKQIVSYVYILHDKDTYTEEEEEIGKGKAGEQKKPHWHIFIKLLHSRTYDDVAKWFDVPPNAVSKVKANTFDDGCIYATHANAPEKYQYSVTEVISSPGFDYAKLVEVKQQSFKREKKKDAAYQRKMEIVSMIEDGTINPLNVHDVIEPEDWQNYNRAIKLGFERQEARLEMNNERNMQCIYIAGKTRACKTALAKMILEQYTPSYLICNSHDPLQNYRGQLGICIDDVSFETFGWKDFLNMADNDTSTPVKSRFRNKTMYCKLLIITTTQEPFELVKKIAGSENENKKQFYRRFKTYYYADYEKIKEYRFNADPAVMQYELVRTIPNLAVPIMDELRKRKDQDSIEIDLLETMQNFANKKKVLILDKRPHVMEDPAPPAEIAKKDDDLFGDIPDLLNLAGV